MFKCPHAGFLYGPNLANLGRKGTPDLWSSKVEELHLHSPFCWVLLHRDLNSSMLSAKRWNIKCNYELECVGVCQLGNGAGGGTFWAFAGAAVPKQDLLSTSLNTVTAFSFSPWSIYHHCHYLSLSLFYKRGNLILRMFSSLPSEFTQLVNDKVWISIQGHGTSKLTLLFQAF